MFVEWSLTFFSSMFFVTFTLCETAEMSFPTAIDVNNYTKKNDLFRDIGKFFGYDLFKFLNNFSAPDDGFKIFILMLFMLFLLVVLIFLSVKLLNNPYKKGNITKILVIMKNRDPVFFYNFFY